MGGHTNRKRKRGCLRRILLLLLLVTASLWFYRYSNDTLQIDRYTYASSRLPAGFDGCRIAILSDLHAKEFGENNETLFAELEALAPEYIFLTGDLIDRQTEKPLAYAADTAAALRAIAPTYYVTGNHEWACRCSVKDLKQSLRDNGITVMSNDFLRLYRNDEVIYLAGIDDPNGNADQKPPEKLAEELKTATDRFWLLLAHRSDRFESEYSLLGADLTISGHAHGGLIRLPFTDGLIGNDHTLFPSYTAGFYKANGHTVLVSRGLGNSKPAFRLFNRPEIMVLTLVKEWS